MSALGLAIRIAVVALGLLLAATLPGLASTVFRGTERGAVATASLWEPDIADWETSLRLDPWGRPIQYSYNFLRVAPDPYGSAQHPQALSSGVVINGAPCEPSPYSLGSDGVDGTHDDVIPTDGELVVADALQDRQHDLSLAMACALVAGAWVVRSRFLRCERPPEVRAELLRAAILAVPPGLLIGVGAWLVFGRGLAHRLWLAPVVEAWQARFAAVPLQVSLPLTWAAACYAVALAWRLRRPLALAEAPVQGQAER